MYIYTQKIPQSPLIGGKAIPQSPSIGTEIEIGIKKRMIVTADYKILHCLPLAWAVAVIGEFNEEIWEFLKKNSAQIQVVTTIIIEYYKEDNGENDNLVDGGFIDLHLGDNMNSNEYCTIDSNSGNNLIRFDPRIWEKDFERTPLTVSLSLESSEY